MPKVTVTFSDVCGDHLPGGEIPDGYKVSFYMSGWRYRPSDRPQPSRDLRGYL